MADHSQKWHDGSSSKNIEISSNSEGIAAIVNKLENLGRDLKKLKENVQAIQVGCQNWGGAHLDKDCPLKEEVKSIKEAKYSENAYRLEEEKAQKRRKVFNWETAKYGRIWYDEDVHDHRSIKNEFLAITFNNSLISGETLSCKPTVSSLNDEIDFRISFEDSNDEDYTVIFDKNSYSYKIIRTNDLKTDLEIDNEKVNIPSFLSSELIVSCFDDLDFFNDFENEFLVIVYNDTQTSKSDLLTEPILSPQHIDEFDLKDEKTYLRWKKRDNDDDKIDIKQPSRDMAPLPPREQRHSFLRMVMEHRDDVMVVVFTSRAWGRLFETRGPLVWELILEFLSTLRFVEVFLDLDAPDTIQEEMESPSVARRFAVGRKSGAHISGGQFICMKIDDTCAWVALGLERQPDVAASAPKATEDAPVIDECGQANPAPMQAPQ
ncbi:hypothetical protein Tco_0133732 [Tanacetum coccineum]